MFPLVRSGLRSLRFAAVAIFGFILMTTMAAAEPPIELLANSCALCHGPDGRSAGTIDSLAGMETDEFLKEMAEFRDPAGGGRIMKPIAQALTEAQTRDLAAYFARIAR